MDPVAGHLRSSPARHYFSEERHQQWLNGWRSVFERDLAALPESKPNPVPTRRYVAIDDRGAVVGIALSAQPSTSGHPDVPPVRERELHILYITRAMQGSGVAEALLNAVLPDGEPAQLWVSSDNARAQAFYRKMGFEADGQSGIYRDLVPEIRMVR